MSQVQGVFFDLDDTLLDGAGVQDALVSACAQIAAARPDLDAARLREVNGEVWNRYWPEVEDKWTFGFLDGRAISFEAWRRTLRGCGYDDEGLASWALEIFSQQALAAHRLFDDVTDVLSRLQTRLPLALISNGASDTQREKLRVLGIEQHFGAIVISGEVGVAKPDVSIFRLALDRLGLEPENVWHVGDSLTADVAGAKAAGLRAVWLNRAGTPRPDDAPSPDHEVPSLKQLATLLDDESRRA